MLPSRNAYVLLEDYSRFASHLEWFRVYCAGNHGKSLSDYIRGHNVLRESYASLRLSASPTWETSPWEDAKVRELLKKIGVILYSKQVTDRDIRRISRLIADFLKNDENEFKKRWFEACLLAGIGGDLANNKLHQSVSDLLWSGKFDNAVITAFKYLDEQLQTILKVSPHEYYGEKLINYAFAPNSGKLQLRTNETEQQGLRNFFSGAYALFRNPSAHRSVQYSEFSASAIIQMVAMMTDLARSLKPRKSRKANPKQNPPA